MVYHPVMDQKIAQYLLGQLPPEGDGIARLRIPVRDIVKGVGLRKEIVIKNLNVYFVDSLLKTTHEDKKVGMHTILQFIDGWTVPEAREFLTKPPIHMNEYVSTSLGERQRVRGERGL